MGLDLFAPVGSAENHALAQRYANASLGAVVTGAVCYYIWGWAGAVVPSLFALSAGWKSIKATKRAVKWERVEEIRAQSSSPGGD